MLESPIVATYYHTLNLIATICSLFLMYIIVYKSPSEMKQFKWVLFKVTLAEELFAINLGLALSPDVVFPAQGAAILGFAKYFGQSGCSVACALVFFWGLTIFTSINDCLIVRSLIIYGKNRLLDLLFGWRGVVAQCILNFGMAIPMWTAMYFALEEPEAFIARSLNTPDYKFIAHFVETNTTLLSMNVDSVPTKIFGGLVIFGITALYLFNIFCAAGLLLRLQKCRSRMSIRTYKAHQSMIAMLVTQNVYPVFAMILPITVCAYGFLSGHREVVESDFYKHLAGSALGAYPIISFIFCILFIRPYQDYLRKFFGRPQKNQVKASVIEITRSSVAYVNPIVYPHRNQNGIDNCDRNFSI